MHDADDDFVLLVPSGGITVPMGTFNTFVNKTHYQGFYIGDPSPESSTGFTVTLTASS
jgi:hypothetical protein